MIYILSLFVVVAVGDVQHSPYGCSHRRGTSFLELSSLCIPPSCYDDDFLPFRDAREMTERRRRRLCSSLSAMMGAFFDFRRPTLSYTSFFLSFFLSFFIHSPLSESESYTLSLLYRQAAEGRSMLR
jgi:hypothetical protein